MTTDLTVFLNGQLVLPDATLPEGMVIVRGQRIEYAGKPKARIPKAAVTIDARGGIIAPGFVDLHVHGGDGSDFMDGTLDAIVAACRCHARHGTTTIFPTSTTASPPQIDAMLRATAQARDEWKPGQFARIAGVHLYGPYFAPDKLGCHRKQTRRDPSAREYDRYFATRLIRIATCAAELPGASDFYRAARRNRCLVTCGHSNSTWQEMEQAFRHGVRHVDHFWCAMSSVVSLRPRCGTPMQASMEQFVLANSEMSTEVIADGHHLSDELLNFAYAMKGSRRLCLVTDSSRAVDMPKGLYCFGDARDEEWFLHDGEVGRRPDGTGLASSTAGMDHMLRIMARATRAPLHELFRMTSLTPAERTGIEADCGSLEAEKRADIVVFDRKLQPRRVWIAGTELAGI